MRATTNKVRTNTVANHFVIRFDSAWEKRSGIGGKTIGVGRKPSSGLSYRISVNQTFRGVANFAARQPLLSGDINSSEKIGRENFGFISGLIGNPLKHLIRLSTLLSDPFSVSFRASSAIRFVAIFVLSNSAQEMKADEMDSWAEEIGGDVIFYREGSMDLAGFPPPASISGTTLRVSMTFSAETFSSLGLDPTPTIVSSVVGADTIFAFSRPTCHSRNRSIPEQGTAGRD